MTTIRPPEGELLGDHHGEAVAPRSPGSGPSGVGLVLGAGGATGAAFHAGTLLALHHDLGWDPNAADVIVGSSAGSIVGCLVRSGLSPDDVAAWGASVPPSRLGQTSRVLLDEVESTRHTVRPSRPRLPIPPRAMLRRLRHPSRFRLHTAALALLPFGWIDAGSQLRRLGDLTSGWPSRPLWITAVRVDDARRVVWGREGADVALGEAVAASCAVPGLFRPVTVNGDQYIDGGAHSATNADVLIGAGVHTAIVISPMSGARTGRLHRPDHLVRALMARRLRAECESLAGAGISVHVFEPDHATLETMGINALDRGRTPRIVHDAFLAAGSRLTEDRPLRQLLGQGPRRRVPGTELSDPAAGEPRCPATRA